MYLDRAEEVEHSKFRALVQVVLTVGAENQDAGIEAFEEYMDKAFPNRRSKKNKKKDDMMTVLKNWVSHGPIGITPVAQPTKHRSKMVSRIASVETGPVASATSKLGAMRIR